MLWAPKSGLRYNDETSDCLVVSVTVSKELLKDNMDADAIANLIGEECRKQAMKAVRTRMIND